MKHNIIKTENYLLIVSNEIPTTWYYDTYINQVRHTGGAEYGESSISKKVIGHLPLNNSPVLEGVPLLPPLEDGETMCPYPEEKQNAIDWHNGYNKAKEKYKYTEEQMKRIYEKGYSAGRNELNSRESDKIKYDYIQSLQQPKMPVAFECEMENKIAIDGHTVIGSEPKTTTNPQGQTVLVGKYIY